ncbi:hypothetical protein [Streptantibioticus cattleyicolor]|uniref:Uncharacterized protein n=1 Tax=Streptantibioticus cattleyicolor (strain ATCC 35852 / DSM 46488 / JCM 4925 / NBRC 14057 / NRRL 8057) TaxID=1003195 RepID=F8JMU9_STREN|nr:hypothetical protein [Streptantibioticus cattleyicolor]AEW99260.1 hypothetical protein SCATT_p10670 [Streptantibioticus cattleyicolor NRRL 8057 = DSM 46488]CCB71696.1 protein of unknown function [Streptantibioticus cattleyicolor NRRL 8057 = DSM 46488]
MIGRLWRARRDRRRYLANLEPWLLRAARDVVFDGITRAQASPSGRAFVGVEDVIDQVRRDLRDQTILGAMLEARRRQRTFQDSVHDAVQEGKHLGEIAEIPTWAAAAALRAHLERPRPDPLPLDTDAYDVVDEPPTAP